MAVWQDFEQHAPQLAELARERFDRWGLALVVTVRADGRPRLSPVEPLITDGQLSLGMMWQSRKALDLRRDPRCLVHSVISDKDGTEGEVKLYGRALEVTEPEPRARYGDALYEAIGWKPDEPEFHLFNLDVDEAAFQVFQPQRRVVRWRLGEPERDEVLPPAG